MTLKTMKDVEGLPYVYNPRRLPEVSGIYFITKGNIIFYIGQSYNIKERIKSNGKFIKAVSVHVPKIHYLEVFDKKNRLALEEYYIGHFLPIYNIKINERI